MHVTKISMATLCLLILGCESKYVEKSPTVVQLVGPTVSQRGEQKATIDKKIDKLQLSLKKVSNIVNQVGNYENQSQFANGISLIQLAEKALSELKQGMPELYKDDLFVRYTTMDNLSFLRSACSEIDLGLSTYPLMKVAGSEKKQIAERAGIFFKSCTSDEQYKPLLFIDTYPQKTEILFVQRSLKFLSPFWEKSIKEALPKCQIESEDLNRIDRITCRDISIELGDKLIGHITSLTYSPRENTVTTAIMNVYDKEGQQLKKVTVTIDNLGHLTFKNENPQDVAKD